MQRTVTLTQRGREGRVTYTEGLRSITGHHEFGSADVVSIVSMGSAREWRSSHAWALKRRSEILRFIAEELIQQQASAGTAEIDEVSGDILLRALAPDRPSGIAAPGSGMRRFGDLRARLGLLGLAAVVAFAAGAWIRACALV